ncbi:DNA-binding transcriptional repressor YebK (plasmid) [Rhodovastum atsumiense]|uniref:MurR/RpiR family transcriptional regulator n=1 Tax=Rhodovastum atsumiense TaxID=504468 RepID=UPI002023BEFA|nr:SIS domain-containing protein [Rhodovastum atsumiense]CAH2605438.1 DNA-binding transcriptional repressor YebK [Rhodovastum atsumiense]
MLARIEAIRDRIRPSEARLGDYVLARPHEVITLSMAEMAARAGVSEPTVARFCTALGCSGFREFKIKLAQNLAGGVPFIHQDVNPGDTPADVAGKLFDRTIATLVQARNGTSPSAIERATDLLATARRIEFYGSGNSGIVAQDIQHKFFRLGIPTVAYNDPHVFNMSALTLGPGDVAVVISNSGRTRDILESARNVLSVGASVLALTRADSPLARLASACLFADAPEDADVYSPMASRITHLVLGDILTVAVALRKGEALQKRLELAKRAVRQRREAD